MAVNKSTHFKVSGEVDGMVYKMTRKGKNYISKKPAAGNKKQEPALKLQYQRTAFLNELAGELNGMIKDYCAFIWPSEFYQRVQSRFRKEPENIRILLLNRLLNMEVNQRNPITKLTYNPPSVTLKGVEDNIILELSANSHPHPDSWGNCYFIEVLLLLWDDSGAPCEASVQRTNWIYNEGAYPVYEMVFPKPDGTTDYLVAVRGSKGNDGVDFDMLGYMGMMIIEVGSFNKKSQKLLLKRREELFAEKIMRPGRKKQPKKEIKVIEPKMMVGRNEKLNITQQK